MVPSGQMILDRPLLAESSLSPGIGYNDRY
jgi:hypothetical protein